MEKPKIYISGPITGLTNDNRLAFERAKQALSLMGFKPVNPHENGLQPGATYNQHLVKDIELLLECDAIYLLKGWTDSDGAMIECFIADNRNLRVFSYHTPIEMLHEFSIMFKENSMFEKENSFKNSHVHFENSKIQLENSKIQN